MPRIFPTGCRITDIRPGKGYRACYTYAKLVGPNDELLISATYDYITEQLNGAIFVDTFQIEIIENGEVTRTSTNLNLLLDNAGDEEISAAVKELREGKSEVTVGGGAAPLVTLRRKVVPQ